MAEVYGGRDERQRTGATGTTTESMSMSIIRTGVCRQKITSDVGLESEEAGPVALCKACLVVSGEPIRGETQLSNAENFEGTDGNKGQRERQETDSEGGAKKATCSILDEQVTAASRRRAFMHVVKREGM